MTVFSNASPIDSDVTDSISATRQVDDAALVGIERTDLLRQPGVLGLAAEKERHLPKLVVFAFAIPHAVDDQPAAFRGLVPKYRRDDMLQRRERFALPANQDVAVLTGKVDTDAVGHLLWSGLQVEIHRVNNLLNEFGNVARRHICCGPLRLCGVILLQPSREWKRSSSSAAAAGSRAGC